MNNFKNQEIRSMLEKSFNLDAFINKREELLAQRNEIDNSIKRLNFIINNLKPHKWPDYNAVIIKQLPGGKYITHRETFKNTYLYLEYFINMYNDIWKGNPPTTHAYDSFSIYHHHGFPATNIDIECCVAITDSLASSRFNRTDYEIKKLDKVDMAASCLHYGPCELIEDTYRYLVAWIEANGYQICGWPMQNYISNENTADISQFRFLNSPQPQLVVIIEIIIPVKKT